MNVKFYPYKLKTGGGRKGFSHAEGGHKMFGVVFMRSVEVLAILKGGTKSFHSLKRGA